MPYSFPIERYTKETRNKDHKNKLIEDLKTHGVAFISHHVSPLYIDFAMQQCLNHHKANTQHNSGGIVNGTRHMLSYNYNEVFDPKDHSSILKSTLNLIIFETMHSLLKEYPDLNIDIHECKADFSINQYHKITEKDFQTLRREKKLQSTEKPHTYIRFNSHYDVGLFNILYLKRPNFSDIEFCNNEFGFYQEPKFEEENDPDKTYFLIIAGKELERRTCLQIRSPWHRVVFKREARCNVSQRTSLVSAIRLPDQTNILKDYKRFETKAKINQENTARKQYLQLQKHRF